MPGRHEIEDEAVVADSGGTNRRVVSLDKGLVGRDLHARVVVVEQGAQVDAESAHAFGLREREDCLEAILAPGITGVQGDGVAREVVSEAQAGNTGVEAHITLGVRVQILQYRQSGASQAFET